MNMPAVRSNGAPKTSLERWFTIFHAANCCDVLSQVLTGEHPAAVQQCWPSADGPPEVSLRLRISRAMRAQRHTPAVVQLKCKPRGTVVAHLAPAQQLKCCRDRQEALAQES